MLERRNAGRRKMVLPVKVSIDNDTHLAHTVDITPRGAQLGALRTQLQPGAIIHLQRGSKKAKFRIAWIRQLAPKMKYGREACTMWTISGESTCPTAKVSPRKSCRHF